MTGNKTPTRCYWELTRRCPSSCIFCRAKGAEEEQRESTLAESLHIAGQLAQCGITRVVLTGGEPVTYPGWERIAAALVQNGVAVWLFTSGVGFEPAHLQKATDAGVSRFLLPIDGDSHTHNLLRPATGPGGDDSYRQALETLRLLQKSASEVSVVTQVNHINAGVLNSVYELLRDRSVSRWQVHLCQLTGNAGRNRDALLQEPGDMERIVDVLLRAAKERLVIAPLHCSIGYMIKEEPVLRGRIGRGRPVFDGCPAGIRTFGITPNGGVKGCTTLEDEFVTASLATRELADILADDNSFPYTRIPAAKHLEAHCARCAMGEICRGGCPAVAYGLTGSIGANPLCLKHLRNLCDPA